MAFEAYLQGDVLLIWRIMARHTPKSLLSEDHGFAPTASEEAQRINSDTGISMVTDQEFWEDRGIVTGEELALSVLSQHYSDLYKSIHRVRPRSFFDSVDDVSMAIRDLDEYANELWDRQELDIQAQEEYERELAELEAAMPTAMELRYQKTPRRSGMGRRNEGKNTMKITARQLRTIIREEKRKVLAEQIDPEMADLQQSMADHILEMLHEEQMYADLDLEDGAVVDALAAALRDVERQLRKNVPSQGVYT